jgi:hypothetical protein
MNDAANAGFPSAQCGRPRSTCMQIAPRPARQCSRSVTSGLKDALAMECNMNMIDLVGYLAASLVFLAFFMKGIAPLRLIALGSNFCFICYAVSLHLIPIVVLHLALIPVTAGVSGNICKIKLTVARANLLQPDLNLAAKRRLTVIGYFDRKVQNGDFGLLSVSAK